MASTASSSTHTSSSSSSEERPPNESRVVSLSNLTIFLKRLELVEQRGFILLWKKIFKKQIKKELKARLRKELFEALSKKRVLYVRLHKICEREKNNTQKK